MLNGEVPVAPAESVTVIVKEAVPFTVGVPEIIPLVERLSPVGNAPLTVHL